MRTPATRSNGPDHVIHDGIVARDPVLALAALLDIEETDTVVRSVERGADMVPPLWQWVHLLERPPQRGLGSDGHAAVGISAPPGPGLQRMFAGGRVLTLGTLRIGTPARRTTSILRTVEKRGRSGPLTFVTVRHEFTQAGATIIVDEHDLVYRPADSLTLSTDTAHEAVHVPGPSLSLAVDEVMLFRFSALTYNAHRIHYDLDWARAEGYPGLLVHGPLQALMMSELLRRNGVRLVGREFEYRLVAPAFCAQILTAVPGANGLAAGAQVRDATGRITAVASIR